MDDTTPQQNADHATVRQNGVAIEHDETAGVYRTRHDWDAEQPLGMVVVSAVAAVAETDPLEIEPLRASLDPDALDDLFTPRSSDFDSDRDEGEVAFSVGNHRVTVSATGVVEIHPRT